MTEPLTARQREAIGWDEMIGLSDLNNRFHYSRPTIDENGDFRILWGGYDAIYHFNGKSRLDSTFRQKPSIKLSENSSEPFPNLRASKSTTPGEDRRTTRLTLSHLPT